VRLAAVNPVLANLVRDAQEAQRTRDELRIAVRPSLPSPTTERDVQREAKLAQMLISASARADELAVRLQKDFPDYARLTSRSRWSWPICAPAAARQAFLSSLLVFAAAMACS